MLLPKPGALPALSHFRVRQMMRLSPILYSRKRADAVHLEHPSRLAVQARDLHFRFFDARENFCASIVIGEAGREICP